MHEKNPEGHREELAYKERELWSHEAGKTTKFHVELNSTKIKIKFHK